MTNKHKILLFSSLAAVFAASTAPIVADKSSQPVYVIMPLIFMGLCLFAAGYYVGLSQGDK
jgi:hypothetical protein